MPKFSVRDPFAGFIEIEGKNIKDAIAKAYAKVPPKERPAYVTYWNWTGVDEDIPVPKGTRRPTGEASGQ